MNIYKIQINTHSNKNKNKNIIINKFDSIFVMSFSQVSFVAASALGYFVQFFRIYTRAHASVVGFYFAHVVLDYGPFEFCFVVYVVDKVKTKCAREHETKYGIATVLAFGRAAQINRLIRLVVHTNARVVQWCGHF